MTKHSGVYKSKKRRKELLRQKKQDEKRKRRLHKDAEAPQDNQTEESTEIR